MQIEIIYTDKSYSIKQASETRAQSTAFPFDENRKHTLVQNT